MERSHQQDLYLPEDILFHIFSYLDLTNQEAIQFSLVSKQFLGFVKKRSSMTFHNRPSLTIRTQKVELNYMVQTLKENVQLQRFTLRSDYWTPPCDAREIKYLYHECVQLAAKPGLRHLHLSMKDVGCDRSSDVPQGTSVHDQLLRLAMPQVPPGLPRFDRSFVVPQAVFLVESLVDLKLENCLLIVPEKTVWPNLKRLSLNKVKLQLHNQACGYRSDHELTLFRIILRGCPLIENLTVNSGRFRCSNLIVSNLRNLKQMNVALHDLQSLEVNATPNLESLVCHGGLLDMGNAEFRNLRYLEMDCHGINDLFFSNFEEKFPLLESLSLDGVLALEKMNISSTSLKKLWMKNNAGLQEACFDVPRLVDFQWTIDSIPKLTFTGKNACITLNNNTRIGTSWFLRLNKFLAALNCKSETSITVVYDYPIPNPAMFLPGDCERQIVANSAIPVHGIGKFTMDSKWGNTLCSSSKSAIIDCIFLICKPQTIAFRGYRSEFSQLLYEKLTSICSINHGVTDFEMFQRDNSSEKESRLSHDRKNWQTIQEGLIAADVISFHLSYGSKIIPQSL